ncbi:ALDH-like protein [Rickenella mellea]|uniref:ALDH-like protein n=1 Tax=Rickenella mellea TaxID=50990 RepID=A0A4Y7QLK5_9AGAM|nr:ALDH-like protein [Rickenella mellea]
MGSNSILQVLMHPLTQLQLSEDSDFERGGGIDVLYLITLFFAFGIWLVFQRYQTIRNRAVPFNTDIPPEADPEWTGIKLTKPNLQSHLSDSDLLRDPNKDYITCFDPATAMFIDTVEVDKGDGITRKIASAQRAQKSWMHSTFADRRRVLRSLLKWLVDNQELCARVACRDTGKTMIDAALGEIMTTCSKLEWLITNGENTLRHEKRRSNLLLSYKRSEVHYEPLGVVAAIVSWNYPLHNAWSPIIASIFAGNGIVVKCSEKVVWSSMWFIGAVQECLGVCGFDRDLVQLVCCWPSEAEALTKSSLIKHITFIGSREVGQKVAIAATDNLTPVTMELGGKDPAVILPGTDLKKWASLWMRGIFQNNGQNCIGIERLIVHVSQHDQLFELLKERAASLRPGSVLAKSGNYIAPVDTGSMIDKDRFSELKRVISRAVQDGADLGTGGDLWDNPLHEGGAYFLPTVIGDVRSEMDIAQTELFAPVAVLMKYGEVEEAIEIANGVGFALGASVFGPRQNECVAVAKQLECGMVSINDFGIFYLSQDLPFGGVKASGYGRFGGPEGLRSLTNPKAIVVDRWPSFIQTGIPTVLDYPVGSLAASWDFVSGLIEFVYADIWPERLRGLARLFRATRR